VTDNIHPSSIQIQRKPPALDGSGAVGPKEFSGWPNAENGASDDLSLDSVFIDVTLVSLNLYNSLVENTTSTEGMKMLIEHIGSLGKGLVVAGEGLNEITMQGQSFAQAHPSKSWQT